MFDLFRSRAKAVRIMLGAMLGVVALSMLVYLIPGTGITAADSSGDQVVAEIGKSTVTVGEVQQQLENVLQNQRLPPEFAATYHSSIGGSSHCRAGRGLRSAAARLSDFGPRFGADPPLLLRLGLCPRTNTSNT